MEEKQLTKEEREKLHEQQIQEKIKREKNKKLIKKISIYSILVIIVAVILYVSISSASKPGKYDDFAKCLTEKGAIMYGNDFCSYTTQQRNGFGKSQKYLNYVKCFDNEDLCNSKQVKITPTWEINNEMYEGVQGFEKLVALTGCGV